MSDDEDAYVKRVKHHTGSTTKRHKQSPHSRGTPPASRKKPTPSKSRATPPKSSGGVVVTPISVPDPNSPTRTAVVEGVHALVDGAVGYAASVYTGTGWAGYTAANAMTESVMDYILPARLPVPPSQLLIEAAPSVQIEDVTNEPMAEPHAYNLEERLQLMRDEIQNELAHQQPTTYGPLTVYGGTVQQVEASGGVEAPLPTHAAFDGNAANVLVDPASVPLPGGGDDVPMYGTGPLPGGPVKRRQAGVVHVKVPLVRVPRFKPYVEVKCLLRFGSSELPLQDVGVFWTTAKTMAWFVGASPQIQAGTNSAQRIGRSVQLLKSVYQFKVRAQTVGNVHYGGDTIVYDVIQSVDSREIFPSNSDIYDSSLAVPPLLMNPRTNESFKLLRRHLTPVNIVQTSAASVTQAVNVVHESCHVIDYNNHILEFDGSMSTPKVNNVWFGAGNAAGWLGTGTCPYLFDWQVQHFFIDY